MDMLIVPGLFCQTSSVRPSRLRLRCSSCQSAIRGAPIPSLSFFGTLKGKCVKRTCFQTRAHARQSIFEYIVCFNNQVRRHSSLGSISPVAFEELMC
ncbi:MAG: hypothetical protein E6I91_01435 [Chloroflexi bacterium]|nr:MAG: hypothetical protein E6I91_01435 [Chloroflexota bacterium]